MNLKKALRRQIAGFLDRQYRKKLQSVQTDYVSWITGLESRHADTRADRINTDFLALPSSDGKWAANATQRIGLFFAAHPDVLLVYGDEDVIDDRGVRSNPWLKPDWSPDTFLCRDYLGSAVAVRRELYEKLTEEEKADKKVCHERLVELAGGFRAGCKAIGHIQEICFHQKRHPGMTEESRKDTGPVPDAEYKDAVEDGENTDAAQGRECADAGLPVVSVVIPSKDNSDVLLKCINSLQRTVTGIDYEIIVVDNGSSSHVRELLTQETEKLNQNITKESCLKKAGYLYEPMEFHFSKMCNLGAKVAEGSLLLFLNDDVEAVEEGWLEVMAAKALEPWAGAVGIKLYYPDSELIQHAGITNIGIGPVHKLQFLKDNTCYYDGRNRGLWNVSAVTGACLLIRKKVFWEAGGFCEELRVAFNDVDLCFTLYEKGYHNIVVNDRHLFHHESLSRGADESEEKLKRLAGERARLYQRHPQLEGRDPYYHPLLNGNVLDTRIRPGYEEGYPVKDVRGFQFFSVAAKIPQDDCLLLRIERMDEKSIQGYAVVLGSDNACFERALLFEKTDSPDTVYRMEFTGQYRPDLQENMPDQENIALCGFCIEFAENLPAGEYRIGALAKDRISGMMLKNMCNRKICFGDGKGQ